MNYADNNCTYTEEYEPEHIYTFTGTVINTGKEQSVTVKAPDLFKYRQGAYIQDAFPYLSPPEREFLLSGHMFINEYEEKHPIKEERIYNMPDIHDMTSDAYPSVSEVLEMIDQANCEHKDMEYQAYEPDTNVPEDYHCLDCGKQFDIPEPDEDELRGDR